MLHSNFKPDLAAVAGLNVTRTPPREDVLLETDSPLILAFKVCGDGKAFDGISYRVRISQNGSGADLVPMFNSPLTNNEDAKLYGIAVSRWADSSPDHDMCVEIPVRIWTDHPKVVDSTIELFIVRFPQVFSAGRHFLRSPSPVEITTTTVNVACTTITTDPSTTTTTTTTLTTSETTSSEQPDVSVMPATINELCTDCISIAVVVGAVLGSFLLAAVVIIIVQIAVIKHLRRVNRETALAKDVER